MHRGLKAFILVIAFFGVVGIGAYAYVVRPTKAPSEPPATDQQNTTANNETPDNGSTYTIVSERSSATFSLDEELRGEHVTVVGTTNSVSGSVTADRNDLSDAQIAVIRVNARTFLTDSEQRNNAIRRLILKTENDANEFITFTTKSISGMPASAEVGQSFPFEATGDLYVAGTTKEVTFRGTAMFDSDSEISGSAETLLHYPDFGITVPDLPFLANVEKDVLLKINFVATH